MNFLGKIMTSVSSKQYIHKTQSVTAVPDVLLLIGHISVKSEQQSSSEKQKTSQKQLAGSPSHSPSLQQPAWPADTHEPERGGGGGGKAARLLFSLPLKRFQLHSTFQ